MTPERVLRNETSMYIISGFMGMVGTYIWTESMGAMFAFIGIAALLGEAIVAITRRLDTLISIAIPK